MNMETTALPPNFDPWAQNVTLLAPDGTPVPINIEAFNQYRIYTARMGINYGTQVGASILLLLVLLLLTRSEKRKSTIFITNALCLTVNAIRCILLSLYLTGTIWNPYSQMISDYTRVSSSDIATTATASVFTLLLTVLIMVSLSLQTWVVCITTSPVQRYIIMGATTLMACVAIAARAAFNILTIHTLLRRENMEKYKYAPSACYIAQAVAIWFFSCIFTWKLGHAIMQRRRLNMPQFGPMQIVFIMGCQTMVIPAIFTVLQFREDVFELGVHVLTLVCIFLPLSAIWAGVVNETLPAGSGPDSHHRLIQGEFYRSASSTTYGSNASKPATDKAAHLSVCTCSTKAKPLDSTTATPSPRKRDSDLYEDEAILVDRDFSVIREHA